MKNNWQHKMVSCPLLTTDHKDDDDFLYRYKFVFWIAIIVLGVAVYSNSFDCSFHFDDFNIFKDTVTNKYASLSDWIGIFDTRPVGMLTFAANYHLHQMDVWGYHLVNLMIHLANAILILYLTLFTLSTPAMKDSEIAGHKDIISFLVALLFVAHPLATQSVTYIAQRFTSLATLFYLLSLIFYIHGRMHQGQKMTFWLFYIISLLCGVAGFLTKEIVFTLPFAILLYELSFFKSERGKFRPNVEVVCLTAFMLFLFALRFFWVYSANVFQTVPPDQGYDYSISAGQYLLTQFRVVATYIRLFFLPINQNLDYFFPVSQSLFEVGTFINLLFLLGVAVLGLVAYRKYRLIFFGIFWFFLTLSVESSIIPISQNVIFEHRTYLAGWGVFLVLTSALFYFFSKSWQRRAVIGMLSILIIACAVVAHQRNEVWKNEVSLWSDCVIKSPLKSRTWQGYGKALADSGDNLEAIKCYDRSIELNAGDDMAYVNRGKSKFDLNDIHGAVADLQLALIVNPLSYDANVGMGEAMYIMGKAEESLKFYQQALKIKQYAPNIYYNIAIIMSGQRKYQEAVENYRKAIALKPDYAKAYNNLGKILLAMGNINAAIFHFQQAIKFEPDYSLARSNLHDTLKMTGRK
jgi:protein O-mannosyl-transferase